jgi:hypothetical protein
MWAGSHTLLLVPATQKVPRNQDCPLSKEPTAKFVDVTIASGVKFRGQAYHTSKKYLLETMGSGVALFDYNNDGRLDIGSDGTFEDVTEQAGLQGVG